jgi:hypothetical protein
MATPPCILSSCVITKAHTFVIKGDVPAVYAMTALARGAGLVAQVTMPTGAAYTIVSSEAHAIQGRVARIKAEIAALPNAPEIQWVRPMTVRLQRLFGWGDVTVTKEEMADAVNREDWKEVRFAIPGSARLIEEGRFDELPALVAKVRGEVEPDEEGALGAIVEHREGELEEEPPYAALYPKTVWRMHPERPKPIYVIDQAKVPEAEKLEWMHQEFGYCYAGIAAFAERFVSIFGKKIRGTIPQKTACLQLYRAFMDNNVSWTRESEMSPLEREQFCVAWGGEEQICHECGCMYHGESNYCSEECESAGKTRVCRYCKVEVHWWFPWCSGCRGRPAPAAVDAMLELRGSGSSSSSSGADSFAAGMDAYCREGAESVARLLRAVSSTEARDEAHEPAWKRRRRT